MTTAAVALEEQRSATPVAGAETTVEASVSALPVAPAAIPHAPRSVATRMILATIVVVQAGWLAVLGYFGYKLLA